MKQLIKLPILLIFLTAIVYAAAPLNYEKKASKSELSELRSIYYAGVENDEYIDSLKIIIDANFGKDHSNYSPIVLAYHAGISALKSKHAFWPFNKMSYLNEAMDIFEKAIERDPDNLEIRFMRFSILYYVPGILGYDYEEESDAKKLFNLLLKKDYSSVDYEIQFGMIEFLIQSDFLSIGQKKRLKRELVLADSNE